MENRNRFGLGGVVLVLGLGFAIKAVAADTSHPPLPDGGQASLSETGVPVAPPADSPIHGVPSPIDPKTGVQRPPRKHARTPPACVRELIQNGAPPMAGATPVTRTSLMSATSVMAAFRYFFGGAVLAQDEYIERAVVMIDHALAMTNTREGVNTIIEENITAPTVPRILTLSSLWYAVEYATIRMATSEDRAGVLAALLLEKGGGQLSAVQPPAADKAKVNAIALAAKEKVADAAKIAKAKGKDLVKQPEAPIPMNATYEQKLEVLLEREWTVYYEQAWWFGRYFEFYARLRSHIASMARNDNCSCQQAAIWLVEELGTRDRNLLALRYTEDAEFNDALVAAGVERRFADTHYFDNYVTLANVEIFNAYDPFALPEKYVFEAVLPAVVKEAKRDAGTMVGLETLVAGMNLEDIDPLKNEQNPNFNDGADGEAKNNGLLVNQIDLNEMKRRSYLPYIAEWMAHSAKRTEIYASFRGMFMDPVLLSAGLSILEKVPGGMVIKQSRFVKWMFSRMRDSKMNRMYAYNITKMNRNPSLSISDKIHELRNLSSKSTKDDPDGSDVFLWVARSTTTSSTMWMEILSELGELDKVTPPYNDKYGDIRVKIDKIEKLRKKGKLRPLSPTFRITPSENFYRFTGGIGAAIAGYYFRGDLAPYATQAVDAVPSMYHWIKAW